MDLQTLEDYKKVRKSFAGKNTDSEFWELNEALTRILAAHQVQWLKGQYAGNNITLSQLVEELDKLANNTAIAAKLKEVSS